ncbi:Vps51/Vps67-domain-containing protein [Myxozyma melibiosi]|uniref:Vacuolar protein sorting-associated protein 51 homolog n=1 Tax=Myxozyma melibiosi TaxID=54550 RepID=A0ABR1F127_9ASCO
MSNSTVHAQSHLQTPDRPSPSSRSPHNGKRIVSSANARRTALREFYALGSDRFTAGVQPSEIDRPDFKADEWLDRFVRENKAREFVAKENTLMHEIRTLEGEGKALVYDNYSKLITATETIQSMRSSMDPLQPTTSALAPAVAHIAEVSATLIATLSEKRKKADEDERERCVRELRAIVDAPERLRRMVREGRGEEARAQWGELEGVLERMGEVRGVERIRRECVDALD